MLGWLDRSTATPNKFLEVYTSNSGFITLSASHVIFRSGKGAQTSGKVWAFSSWAGGEEGDHQGTEHQLWPNWQLKYFSCSNLLVSLSIIWHRILKKKLKKGKVMLKLKKFNWFLTSNLWVQFLGSISIALEVSWISDFSFSSWNWRL